MFGAIVGGVLTAATLVLGTANGDGQRQPGGLWLLPRHDAGNSGRADASARMRTAPDVVGRFGGEGGAYSFVQRMGEGYLVQIGRGLAHLRAEGEAAWSRRTLGIGVVVEVGDLNGDGRDEALVSLDKKGSRLSTLPMGKRSGNGVRRPGRSWCATSCFTAAKAPG